MSNTRDERAERLLEAVTKSPPWSYAVERHLDGHPLPVDEAAVAAVTARLQARITPESHRVRWLWLVVPALCAAAAGLLWMRGPVRSAGVLTVPEAVIYEADVDDGRWVVIPEEPWVEPLIVPDGLPRHPLSEAWDEPAVDAALRDARWDALSDPTLTTLEHLLEEMP